MIELRPGLEGIAPAMLHGFFEGWPDPPSPETLHRILAASHACVLAVDRDTGRVAGFVNALSDGVLTAYLPLLEVRREYRGRGLGRRLVETMLDRLGPLYMVDVVCDPDLERFYAGLGFARASAMVRRDYDAQAGVGNEHP